MVYTEILGLGPIMIRCVSFSAIRQIEQIDGGVFVQMEEGDKEIVEQALTNVEIVFGRFDNHDKKLSLMYQCGNDVETVLRNANIPFADTFKKHGY